MDPFTAIGLAASIVQFLEFGRKLVSGAVEIYRNVDGATSSNILLEQITTDLHDLCNELDLALRGKATHLVVHSEVQLVPLLKVRADLRS